MKDIVPLVGPFDESGRELFHGSLLHFEEVPIRYYSKEALDFWLSSRQIKSPATLPEIRCLASKGNMGKDGHRVATYSKRAYERLQRVLFP